MKKADKLKRLPGELDGKPSLGTEYFEKKFDDILDRLDCIQRAIANHRKDTSCDRHLDCQINQVKKE
jgi:hypothetical protein